MGLREGRTSQGGRRTPLGPAVHTIKRDDPAHVPAGTSSQRSQANAFARCGLSCHAGGPVNELAGPQHRVHHHRELSGDCDGGTLEADPFLELEPPCGRVARIRGGGAMTPTPFWAHAMRTDSGRPSSSMRFRTWTATSISVARRSSVRERSPSPITRLNRPMVASARARFVYPDAFCQAILPFSAMSWRWRSRWVGAVSAVALGTAVERGGTMTAASGWRSATLA